MWNFASSTFSRGVKLRNELLKRNQGQSECSDDEASDDTGSEEALECPICLESFNLVENVPYVLLCGHTLCKHCLLRLPWAALRLSTLPINLPFFISCPWCNLWCFRFFYKDTLRFPRKNYFLLWMVEGMNGERARSYQPYHSDHRQVQVPAPDRNTQMRRQVGVANMRQAPVMGAPNHHTRLTSRQISMHGFDLSLRKSWAFFLHLTVKFLLVVIFLLIILYVIPASAVILALYILITVLFALPAILVLFFAYPSLDWLVREIVT